MLLHGEEIGRQVTPPVRAYGSLGLKATCGWGTTEHLRCDVRAPSGPNRPVAPRARPWYLGAALSATYWAAPLPGNGSTQKRIIDAPRALESPAAIHALQAHERVLAATRLAKAGLPVSHGLPAAGACLRLFQGRLSSYPELARNLSHALTAATQLSCEPGCFSSFELSAAAQHFRQQLPPLPVAPSLLTAHTYIPAQNAILWEDRTGLLPRRHYSGDRRGARSFSATADRTLG